MGLGPQEGLLLVLLDFVGLLRGEGLCPFVGQRLVGALGLGVRRAFGRGFRSSSALAHSSASLSWSLSSAMLTSLHADCSSRAPVTQGRGSLRHVLQIPCRRNRPELRALAKGYWMTISVM
jgi:hypothetical protein